MAFGYSQNKGDGSKTKSYVLSVLSKATASVFATGLLLSAVTGYATMPVSAASPSEAGTRVAMGPVKAINFLVSEKAVYRQELKTTPLVQNEQVKVLQQGLQKWDSSCLFFTPDGQYGPATARCIEKFQRENSLPATGNVDAQTALSLVTKGIPFFIEIPGTINNDLKQGDSNSLVTSVKSTLIRNFGDKPNCQSIPASPILDAQTVACLKDIQKDNNLYQSGRIDVSTAKVINAKAGTKLINHTGVDTNVPPEPGNPNPGPPSEITDVLSLASGSYHNCAVKNNSIYCWGDNTSGQLGNGVISKGISTPVRIVLPADRPVLVAAGGSNTCALDSQGVAYCWGSNKYGQIGNGETGNAVDVPTQVKTGVKFKELSVGDGFVCGISTGDGVYCWGSGMYNQLGNGTNISRSIPVQVSGMSSGYKDVATAQSSACALKNDGTVSCWGSDRYGLTGAGKPGDMENQSTARPTKVSGNYKFTALDAGAQNICGITTGSGLACWGDNSHLQLGSGFGNAFANTPILVNRANHVKMIAVGTNHICASLNGRVNCWGSNSNKQMGISINGSTSIPSAMNSLVLSYTRGLSANVNSTCGISPDAKSVYCWGSNSNGQKGDGANVSFITSDSSLDSAEPVKVLIKDK